MELTLEQWFAELDRHVERIPLEVLTSGLKRLHDSSEVLLASKNLLGRRQRAEQLAGDAFFHMQQVQ